MPKAAAELSALDIKRLDKAGKYAVGGVAGLYFTVEPGGSRYWSLRVVVGKMRREIGLGGFPSVTLAQARQRAREARDQIRSGVDPVEERKAAKARLIAAQRRGLTFADALDRYATEKVKEFRSEKYRVQWRTTIEKHALPELGKMLVSEIELQDVLRVLQPLWSDRTDTAAKLRQRIEAVLNWATVHGHRTGENPARWAGNLKLVLPAPSRVSEGSNFPSLQLKDAQRWWTALCAREGMGAKALQFQALTATRAGAIRFASWAEIDLQAKVWTIQPGRKASKIAPGDKPKRVPLTDDMVTLLQELPRIPESDLVFWAPKGGALSDATLGKVMRVVHEADVRAGGKGFVDASTGEAVVPHGLRSSFRTWVSERTTFDGDMAEVALFHKVGNKVQQAYDRSDMLERRRQMMAAWSDFLHGRA